MLAQDYLTLRLVRLKAPDEWVSKLDGLCFLFPKGGAGKCLCGPLNQRLAPGDVLVMDGAVGHEIEDSCSLPRKGMDRNFQSLGLLI